MIDDCSSKNFERPKSVIFTSASGWVARVRFGLVDDGAGGRRNMARRHATRDARSGLSLSPPH